MEDDEYTGAMNQMSHESHPMEASISASHLNPTPQPKAKSIANKATDSNILASPLNGTILEIHTANGKSVVENQVVIVLEAMKMKTNISSPFAGVVRSVEVSIGESIETGQTLLTFE